MIFQKSSFTSSQRPIHTHFQPQNLPLSSRFSPKIIPSNLTNSSAQPSAAKAEKEKTVNSSPDLEKNPTQRQIEKKIEDRRRNKHKNLESFERDECVVNKSISGALFRFRLSPSSESTFSLHNELFLSSNRNPPANRWKAKGKMTRDGRT
jgi:hypothetical protein